MDGNRRKKHFVYACLAGVVVLAVMAWFCWTPLVAWYYVRGLTRTDEGGRETWVNQVAGLEDRALPGLLASLRQGDSLACTNVKAGLAKTLEGWPPGDGRRVELCARLGESFANFGPSGKSAALDLMTLLLDQTDPTSRESIQHSACTCLMESSKQDDSGVHSRAFELAFRLFGDDASPDLLNVCRELARTCFKDALVQNRLDGIRLALRPGMEILPDMVFLLADPQAEVRRAAMLAVAPSPGAVNTDDLLRWLHDPDDDVRKLCEKALRVRGLNDEHLRLGKLMTDDRPKVRLEVVDLLSEASDLEPGVWLRRLSHDPIPAVRAAAVRAAGDRELASLSDRLEQISQNDPSPTVRQLADHYLKSRRDANAIPANR